MSPAPHPEIGLNAIVGNKVGTTKRPVKQTRAIILLILSSLWAGRPALAVALEFEHDIRPLLQNYCIKCHGSEKSRGGLNFEAVKSQQHLERDPKRIETMVRLLRDR